MSQRDFNQAVLEAQGVSPTLAQTIAENFAKLERQNEALRQALEPLALCAQDFYRTAPGQCQLETRFHLHHARAAAAAMGLPEAARYERDPHVSNFQLPPLNAH